MSLRLRLTLVAATVVAIVVASASVTTYFVMRHELYSQVDNELAQHAQDPRAVFRSFSQFSGDYVTLIAPAGHLAAEPPGSRRLERAHRRRGLAQRLLPHDDDPGLPRPRNRRPAPGRRRRRRLARRQLHRPRPQSAAVHPAARVARRRPRRRARRRTRLPRNARSGAAPDGGGRAHRADARSERTCSRDRAKRDVAPRRVVQHDARSARRRDRDTAALRRRRVARAAHASDEHPDEHRRAEAAGPARARRTRQALRRPPARGARDAGSHRRTARARAQRACRRGALGRPARRGRRQRSGTGARALSEVAFETSVGPTR